MKINKSLGQIASENDILTKSIKEILDSCPKNDNSTHAINIMHHIRGYKDKYFRITDQEFSRDE